MTYRLHILDSSNFSDGGLFHKLVALVKLAARFLALAVDLSATDQDHYLHGNAQPAAHHSRGAWARRLPAWRSNRRDKA
jgi:hypothetical protein